VLLKSHAVTSAGYDAETRTLEIEFSSGRVYRFSDVPASVYAWLLRVPNKGVYVTRSITGRYAYEDLTRPGSDDTADLEALLEASLAGSGERT
jgi:hypothetical protein